MSTRQYYIIDLGTCVFTLSSHLATFCPALRRVGVFHRGGCGRGVGEVKGVGGGSAGETEGKSDETGVGR